MLPDGFSVHEVFITTNSGTGSSNAEDGLTTQSHHRLFHGTFVRYLLSTRPFRHRYLTTFHEGSYHDGTMHTDCVVYTGTLQFNRPLEVVGSKDGSVLPHHHPSPPQHIAQHVSLIIYSY